MRIFATLIGLLVFGMQLWGQNYPMNGLPITDCDGFFLDSGGNNSGYSPNEDFLSVICPDQTTGTHIELSFSGVQLGDGDSLCFYDGPQVAADKLLACADDFLTGAPFIIQATAANSSGCLTVTFKSDATSQSLGWSAVINCIPSCQTIQSALASTSPAAVPLVNGYIDICIGDEVSFEGVGNYLQNNLLYAQSDVISKFKWSFGDGTFGEGKGVSHVYNEPGGYTVELEIIDQFGCENTNFISQRVRVAPRPTFNISDDIPTEICYGDTIRISSGIAPNSAMVTAIPQPENFNPDGFRVEEEYIKRLLALMNFYQVKHLKVFLIF